MSGKRLSNKMTVEADAQTAWNVLGERFGEIHLFTQTLSSSELDGPLQAGAVRTCQSAQAFGPFPPGIVTEKLLAFDRDEMTFTYVAVKGLPGFMKRAQNTWRVSPVDDKRCEVASEAVVEVVWWAVPLLLVLPMMLNKAAGSFFAEVKAAIEQSA